MKTNILQTLLTSTINSSSTKDIESIKNKFKENTNISTILKDKNIQTILKDLLSDIVNQNKTTKTVLEILQKEPIFKELKSFSSELKLLVNLVEKSNIKSDLTSKLKMQIIDIKNIDDQILKEGIGKSGIFLESYLKNLSNKLHLNIPKTELKQNILEDIKSILLQLKEELPREGEYSKQTTKLLNQIDYYQLLSISNYSNHTYLPFNWDDLENGDINFNQEEDDNFSCHINLELKYYGEVKINILFNKPNNLSISFFLEQNNLKEKIQSDLKLLRKSLKNINIQIENIFIFDLLKNKNQSQELKAFTNYNNHIGVDIKV